MTVSIVMERVDAMPTGRGRRGYVDQAKTIHDQLVGAGGPMLVGRDSNRNALETLSRHLREFDNTSAVVVISEKNGEGKPVQWALYAEHKAA